MVYSPPQLNIFQQFEAPLAAGVAPLHAMIIGPKYELHRFDVEAERALLDEYDRTIVSEAYAWPDKIAGGVIELGTAKIVVDQAKLEYYQIDDDVNVTVDNGNKIKSSTNVVYKTNSAANRDAAFGTRDVQVGDGVRLSWVDGVLIEHDTVVAGFVAEVIAGTTDPTNVRQIGVGDKVAGFTEGTSPAPPTRLATNYDVSAYSGLVAGYPEDTYTIRVTAVGFGTTSGGTLDGTKLEITSAGGDPLVERELGQAGAAWDGIGMKYDVDLGSRGAILEITDGGAPDHKVGDYWTVTVSQNYTEVDVTNAAEFDSFGPYTGDKNTQYIITCTSGGTIGTDNLLFSFTTNNGADISGTLSVPAADFGGPQVDYPIGNQGMNLSFFDTTQWNTGDVVVFDVVGEQEGPIETLILRDAVPVVAATTLDLQLFAFQTEELDESFVTFTQDDITIFGGATITANILGTEQAHNLYGGIMYADYRELDVAAANSLDSVSTSTEALEEVGPDSLLNPLGKGVAKALENSAGVTVYYIAVESDDVSGYNKALGILTENRVIYGLVPLSDDEDIKDLVVTHVLDRSNEKNNQWRIGWLTNPTDNQKAVSFQLPDESDILATVSELSPGQYRTVNAVGATFITDGVEPGDTLRINYSTDAEGNVTYDEYEIDRVESEEELVILTGPASPITVAIKIEVWRTLTNAEYAEELSLYPAQYNDRRIYVVWADNPVESDGTSEPLYYTAAALSGERSGVPPHAPLSEVSVLGVDLEPVHKFSRDDNNTVASGGNWIVSKDSEGRVFTRHQLSSITNPDDLIQREQTFTTNTDHISRDIYNNTRDLVGQGNVSPDMLALIRQRIHSRNEAIRNTPYSAIIGPQIIDVEILEIAVHPTLRDTVIVRLDYDLPAPLNRLEIYMNIGVA